MFPNVVIRNRAAAIIGLAVLILFVGAWQLPLENAGVVAVVCLGLAFLAAVALAITKMGKVTLEDKGIRVGSGIFSSRLIPYDAIEETRLDGAVRLLGFGGKELASVDFSKRGNDFVEELLRAMGPRRRPEALASLGRTRGESMDAWRARLDARANSLGGQNYRTSNQADVEMLEDAMISHELALDLRAGAAYVLAAAHAENANQACARALSGDAPPIVIAMADKGGFKRAGVTRVFELVGAEVGALHPRVRVSEDVPADRKRIETSAEVREEAVEDEKSDAGIQRAKH